MTIKTIITLILSFLVVLLITSSYMIYSYTLGINNIKTTEQYQYYANQLLTASTSLSDNAFKYIVSEDKSYYDAYMTELKTTKTREGATKSLIDLGISKEEELLIDKTLELSNYLVLTELAAFDLIGNNIERDAATLLFDDYYENTKKEISDNYTKLINDINLRFNESNANSLKVINLLYIINIFVVFLIGLLSVILLARYFDMRKESEIDKLTGLLNRNKYKDKIQKLIDDNPNKFGALIFCDIDNLKFINDSYGHNDGDNYIYAVSQRLNLFNKYNSVISRQSGDEFVIYIHGFESVKELKDIITIEIDITKNAYFTTSMNTLEKIRYSSGVAIYPTDATNIDDLKKYADYSLIKMKKISKGSIEYFDKINYETGINAYTNKGHLDELFEKELLDFVFQPIVDARTYNIFAYEALMRPQSKIINSPLLLLQLAKDEYKLANLERIVFKIVLEKINANKDKFKDSYIFINSIANQVLSNEELHNYNLKYPGIFEKIFIEVTEQEHVSEQVLSDKTNNFRKYGCSIALDDYGAGYSNEFTLLSGLYDIIKIDMKLIRGIDTDPKRQEIISSLIKVAKISNFKVLAEGVEFEDEARVLKTLGVDYFQGYYFAKPSSEISGLQEDVLDKIKNL
ncbi:MAG: EAL domain-containing protein [Lachnospirales bacterium]